jgi:pilus assembly protein CpaB
MNRRLLTILLLAFIIAAGSGYVVYRLIGRQLGSQSKTAKIVVAVHDLEIGALIKATDVKMGEVVGEVPKDVLLKAENAVGRGVVSQIYAGEPVSDKRLALVGSGAGLAATIPPGMRACAVKVDDVVGVAGFATPGMRVDVLISGTTGVTNGGNTKVRTLLQNIEVLSAGQNFQKDDEGKPVAVPVVNLLVTPEQAELLTLASSNQTRIQLVLRNPVDSDITETSGSEMTTLFGGPAEPKAPPPAAVFHKSVPAPVVAAPAPVQQPAPPSDVVIEVSVGGKHMEQKFQSKGTQQ